MRITPQQMRTLLKVKQKFLKKTEIPKPDNWKRLSDNDIWLKLFDQVVVVGSSAPAEKLGESKELQRRISYNRLSEMNPDEAKKEIHYVLREIGARYVSKEIEKSKKTEALVHNLKVIKNFGGPKALIKRVSEIEGDNSDIRKAKYLMKVLKYIGSKSARDLLMSLGVIRDAIAFDVNVMNFLEEIGIKVPKNIASSPKVYDKFEKEILENVCKRLKISGIEFDRMIYWNIEDILESVL